MGSTCQLQLPIPRSAKSLSITMRQSLRRKSCSACVRSKRRCNLSVPRCSHCAAKDVECSYPTVPAPSPPRSNSSSTIPSLNAPLDDPMTTFQIHAPNPIFPETSLSQSSDLQLSIMESHSQPAETLADFTDRAEFCAHLMGLQPKSMAEKGFNVFIHRTQTLASDALRETLASSALYAMRSVSNASFVDSEITRRASKIVHDLQLGSISDDTFDLDMLPLVQALLVYQCMRLFSPGKISQQTQAERDNIVLQLWASRLHLLSESCGSDELKDIGWEPWIEKEAIRRTLICIELVQGTYSYLRGLWPIGVRCHHELEFYAQKSLWEARSLAEWRLVCDDPAFPALPCNMLRLDQDIRDASPNDLDDLGALLRVAGEGVEKLKSWLGHDKQALQRWGHVH
ncbi:hypothetical protein F53441_6419 [Fusarium austroafricanum]|uniref:Zn(2)-C6 fungal-type domain-containing protein n=1 Tax=Fusarium austroafricanum TaxID=2364996 RepID=A0A8H4NWJ9_9HYPO|nr:hypothetical protein F53441_6419 [Fusarium austroafricanum]